LIKIYSIDAFSRKNKGLKRKKRRSLTTIQVRKPVMPTWTARSLHDFSSLIGWCIHQGLILALRNGNRPFPYSLWFTN